MWLATISGFVAIAAIAFIPPYTPLFAIDKITVAGVSTIDPAEVENAVASQMGRPLGLIDRSEVRAALMKFPLIESYSLEARPPRALNISIRERVPIGVVMNDGRYTLVDAAGVVLSTSDSRPEGQPVLTIQGGLNPDVLQTVGLVIRSLPGTIRGELAEVSASTGQDITFTLSTGVVVMWGNADKASEKAFTLQRAFEKIPGMSYYDVSAPSTLIVR